MAKGICPVCDELVGIHPTDIALEYRTDCDFGRIPVGSSRYQQVVMHPDKREPPDEDGRWPICLGTGRMI